MNSNGYAIISADGKLMGFGKTKEDAWFCLEDDYLGEYSKKQYRKRGFKVVDGEFKLREERMSEKI